ncbi:MAG: LPP20 family lipoprotein [Cyclobacteriaceae bacterium]|nr:LPP20 family lipoprotein [Cyclobacteriaceae bacterium]MCH8514917.1 LPP20 family lipoprotein [Cyclobacteriaceae bacterium]
MEKLEYHYAINQMKYGKGFYQLIFLLFVLFLVGCASSRQPSFEEQMKGAPDWVRRTPSQPGFFQGVGTATKSGNSDFREQAQNNALNELANSISVNVSSESVLNSFQLDASFSEMYRRESRISSARLLEGYELVDTWENQNQFWVYYRLSQSKYNQIREERLERAKSESLAKFREAQQLQERSNFADAFRSYVQAFDAIGDFLGENITYSDRGVESPYGVHLSQAFADLIRAIEIKFPDAGMSYRWGSQSEPIQINVRVIDEKGSPLSNIPIITRVSWMPGTTLDYQSDRSGNVRIRANAINSRRREEEVSCRLDINRMLRSSNSGEIVRRVVQQLNTENYVYPIRVEAPSFYFSIDRQYRRPELALHTVENELSRLLTSENFNTVGEVRQSDYRLRLVLQNPRENQSNGRFSFQSDVELIVENAKGAQIYRQQERGLSGVSNSKSQAEEEFVNVLIARLRIGLFPNMVKAVF